MVLDMAYTKTDWLETSMSTAQKLTALDNLEGMYNQIKTYIDAITHSGIYYTDAEAAAKFFSSSTDGSGSGLICATLDGYTAQQIIDAGSPSGVIAWWSGSVASIPSGWLLCNGLNSTPDLRGKFVAGAGSHYSKGDTGGTATVTTTASVTVAGHSLTAGEIPLHTHTSADVGISAYANGNPSGGAYYYVSSESSNNYNSGSAGSGSSHTHTASFAGTTGQAKLPPYYALCYIMKS